jgi:2-polyprenyl-6-methoxyphenol hydroxylase-like FAD-dependent oxidoreductase
VDAFDTLGLAGAIRSQGIGGVQGGLRSPNGDALVAIPADVLAKQLGNLVVIHRADLLALLAQQIDPKRLHLGQACVGFEQNGDEITARFQNGETARADALIGADGLRSLVRTQMFGSLPIRYSGYTAWRAVVEPSSGHSLLMGETWGRGCRFGIIPMSGGRVYWFATNNAPEGDRNPEGRTKEQLSRLFRGWHEPIEALIAAAQEGSILRNDIYDMDPLPKCVLGRAALLGDAAHAMTPNLGQGACQAIEDAVVLAACLKKNASVTSALLEYERRRIPRTRKFVLGSRWFGVIAQRQNPALCWLRNAAIRATPQWITARQVKSLLAFEILTASERLLFSQS